MKLIIVLALCALVTATPRGYENADNFELNLHKVETPEGRNILINILIRQLFEFLRRIINEGWEEQGIPVLEPLVIEKWHLLIPAGIINLDLQLQNIVATGIGQFVVHKSNLNLTDFSMDLDISFPVLDIRAERYSLDGNIFSAVPLYGAGRAGFLFGDFDFQAKFYLAQSEDGKSIIIDRIENAAFKIPSVESHLTGVIGGGDVDVIVNKVAEEVIFDYINRFQGAISNVASRQIRDALNPFLSGLDSWRFIAIFMPR